MSTSYGINAIGADPMFQAYLAQQNYLTQQNDATRVSNAYKQALEADPTIIATQTMTSSKNKKEESHTLRNIAIAAGATALIYACYKGKNGNPIDGAKTIYNDLKGVWNKVFNNTTKKSIKSVKEILNKDIQEYTVMKDGMEFLMKDGKPVQIITADKKVITDAAKVAEWVKNNDAAKNLIRGLDVSSGTLPKGVSLSYTKEIVDGSNTYKLIVENGKVVKALSKDSAGNFIEKDLATFVKENFAKIKEAETLTKTSTLDHVRLLDSSGKLADAGSQNITWSVRRGKVVSASIGGRTLDPKELKALQRDFGTEIKLFGKEAAGTYKDINSFEYIYRTSKADAAASPELYAGQRIRFSPNVSGHTGKNWITELTSINRTPLTGTDEIKAFLEKNTEIQNSLNKIASNGTFTNGFRLGNYVIKSDSGNILTFGDGHILKTIQKADGTTISGEKDITDWLKIAANENEYRRYCS